MRSQSIKAQSRSETSLTVLLIKTDRLRPDMTIMPRVLVSVVRAALVVSSSFSVAPEVRQRSTQSRGGVVRMLRLLRGFDAFLTPASTTVQGDIKGAASDR